MNRETDNRLHLGRFIFSRMLPLMVLLLTLVSMGAFHAYYSINIKKLEEKGRLIADETAFFLRSELSSRPLLWKYNTPKILEYARSYLVNDPDLSAVAIIDEDGDLLGTLTERERADLARRGDIWIASALDMDGKRYGTVWVGMSPRRVKKDAARLILPLLLLGLALSFGLYMYVRRTVQDSRRQIETLVGELEDSRRVLEALNRDLELIVEDRTARLRSACEGLEKSRRELAGLAVKTVMLDEEEKKRLSRELHDGAGQALTAIRINLDLLAGKGDGPRDLERIRLDTVRLVDDTLDEIRRVVSDMRPAVLDDLAFGDVIVRHMRSFAARVGVEAEVDVRLGEGKLPPAVESTLYRVVQEATTNIARHSKAGKVALSLLKNDSAVRLDISDDGVGFDPGGGESSGGRGLRGMRERVEIMGGEMIIEAGKGMGTKLAVKIPI
jgi:signal transduction histidine kinase